MIAVTRPNEVIAYQYVSDDVHDFPHRLVRDVLKVLPDKIVLLINQRIVTVEDGEWIVDDGTQLTIYTDTAFNNKFYIPQTAGAKYYAV